jgi:uncharacterized SAM-binding protein YcdF (DUF218 family)
MQATIGFVLSKVLWAFFMPPTLLLLVLLCAWLLQRRRPALSRTLLGLGVLFLAVLAICPIGYWAATPLETRFPVPGPLTKVDGIIVLGGAIDMEGIRSIEEATLNDAAERMTTFVALAHQYPEARLVFTGGSGIVREQQLREADAARLLFESMGVDPARLSYERESRTTWENAVNSHQLIQPQPGQTWLLVTSAWHMPRAVGCFRAAGWEVTAYPTDFLGHNRQWGTLDIAEHMRTLTVVEKEWIGMLVYHLLGHSDALYPAPRAAH